MQPKLITAVTQYNNYTVKQHHNVAYITITQYTVKQLHNNNYIIWQLYITCIQLTLI